jgi:hypothetical protein
MRSDKKDWTASVKSFWPIAHKTVIALRIHQKFLPYHIEIQRVYLAIESCAQYIECQR